MNNLEKICKWREIVLKRKIERPDYHPLGNPLFNCLYCCSGYDILKGCYKSNKVNPAPSTR